jgi:multicomponent K+:H+ antiporter subunit E
VTRLLPYPVAATAMLLAWLLLAGSAGPGAVLLGLLFASGGAWLLAVLGVPPGRLRRVAAASRLLGIVLVEVFRSNNAVARIILARRDARERRSGFVRVRLEMRSQYGLAALACILTATPGTVWVDYDARDGMMLLHVLDLIDEEEWVRIIKDRWERRLMEIFE